MTDKEILVELWKKVQMLAKNKYEADTYEGAWEKADKYEREDYVFTEYMKLNNESKN